MPVFLDALQDEGGVLASPSAVARLRSLHLAELDRAAAELDAPRSGYGDPIVVAIAYADGRLAAALPVALELRADPAAAGERAWLLAAATVGALVDAFGTLTTVSLDTLGLQGGDLHGRLAVALAAPGGSTELAELAAYAFEEQSRGIDRLRAVAVAVPAALFDDLRDLRDPIGARHPLRVAEAAARLGARPAEPETIDPVEEAMLGLLLSDRPAAGSDAPRPHDDPDPARRVARRILQRLDGMGKWGGYHTDFSHLARGFAGNERALANDVGEALVRSGLLAEKPSVGQRHVFLNPRRAKEIHALIERGEGPADLRLP